MGIFKYFVFSLAIPVVALYVYYSFPIFKQIQVTSHTVIDEEFHIPQGLQYCNFNFSTWDPKITTLPGLYLLSTVFLGLINITLFPFNIFIETIHFCHPYYLRLVNYIVGIVNLCLFFTWFSIFNKNAYKYERFLMLLSSFNLAILPPMFFFTNVYYTDVASIMFIMLLLIYNKLNKHVHASVCGLLSVLVRQTNIIWVAMLFGEYSLKQFYHYCIKDKNKKNDTFEVTEEDIKKLTIKDFEKIFTLEKIPKETWSNVYAYIMVILSFIIFVIINEGIVVGDKTAHVAVVHIPQLFYYSLFCLVFAWPHFLNLIMPFIKYIKSNISYTIIITLVIALIVYFNTLVHPYLLADNRHYTFYIWNRFYEKLFFFRYAIIPVYLFGLYSIICNIYSKTDVTFALVYLPCTIFVLILQKMIEVRYFLIPFIILRCRISSKSILILFIELLMYYVINQESLTIFFTKNIYWDDLDYVQKLIW